MSPLHRNVPVGTLVDTDGSPVTIRREYDWLRIPECQLDLDQLPLLRRVLDNYERQARACIAKGEDHD